MTKTDIETVYTDGETINHEEYRNHIGIKTQQFRCSLCKKTRSYTEHYGGTYEHDALKQHFCIECIMKLGKIIHIL